MEKARRSHCGHVFLEIRQVHVFHEISRGHVFHEIRRGHVINNVHSGIGTRVQVEFFSRKGSRSPPVPSCSLARLHETSRGFTRRGWNVSR